ncbi:MULTISPECIES: hypothetical protein [Aeromonas]|uniref:hypothetical protein n=1 Tax=Aeromonas TaxID=642 RepID=UPI000946D0A6|nr:MULTISPECIES: hypothetical protein [Aeromonas]OLF19750.1 hypothetical protein BSP75_20835 [Aeromonas sp. YN13HZO-058]TNI91752.1 hypothetical protein CF120_08095 [Aeromonas allosaccharophila]BBT81255.1 hypothetical protein WP8S18E11_29210 [Aeromonas veronii]
MKERRQGPDWLTRVLRVLVLLCWGGFIVLLSLYHYARPEIAYGFLVYGGIQVRDYWDPALTPWLVHGLWGCCALTLAVLLLERKRSRRRDDALHVNLAILLLVLIAGLLFYYVG